MGQQQLILLVLATVIVGIAIVVGIRAFTENSAKANADALMQDAVRMANDAQAAVKRPDPFGGVPNLAAITNPGQLGYAVDGAGVYTNLNGQFTISAQAPGIRITAVDDTTGGTPQQNVQVTVCGETDASIHGAIMTIAGQATGNGAPTCP